MPQVYLEVKVPKAGKFERPCPLPDITEYAAFFNRDRSSARSKVGWIYKSVHTVSRNTTTARRELCHFQQNFSEPFRHRHRGRREVRKFATTDRSASPDNRNRKKAAGISAREYGFGLRSWSRAVAQLIHQYLVLAAIDFDHRAVDEERQIGCQVSDQVGDLLNLGDTAERDARRCELVGFLVA